MIFKNAPLINSDELSDKPNGLWYSFGTQWLDWCEEQQPEWIMKNTFKLEIKYCNILKITNIEEFVNFEETYSFTVERYKSIKWHGVMIAYDGIEIYDKNNFKRLPVKTNNYHWYNTWDIGSGCIWKNCNVAAIKPKKVKNYRKNPMLQE